MKKVISLLLALVLCLSLCACGGENDTPETTEAPTEMTQMAPTEATVPTTLNVEETEAMEWLCGEWSNDENSITFNSDNSCVIDGETLRWEFYHISSPSSFSAVVYNGDNLCYRLSSWTEDMGYSVLMVYPVDENGNDGTQIDYLRNDEWTIVEITMENWSDYIEFAEVGSFPTNDFGEKTLFISYDMKFKDGIITGRDTSVSIEIVSAWNTRSITINADDETFELGESTFSNESEEIFSLKGNTSKKQIGFTTENLAMDATEVSYTACKEVLRASGTIYIFNAE